VQFSGSKDTHLDYDATIATSHLRRGTSEEAEAPRHLTHHKLLQAYILRRLRDPLSSSE